MALGCRCSWFGVFQCLSAQFSNFAASSFFLQKVFVLRSERVSPLVFRKTLIFNALPPCINGKMKWSSLEISPPDRSVQIETRRWCRLSTIRVVSTVVLRWWTRPTEVLPQGQCLSDMITCPFSILMLPPSFSYLGFSLFIVYFYSHFLCRFSSASFYFPWPFRKKYYCSVHE